MFATLLIAGVVLSVLLLLGGPRQGMLVAVLIMFAATANAAEPSPPIMRYRNRDGETVLNPYCHESAPMVKQAVPSERKPARAMLLPTLIERTESIRDNRC
ncbi:MAG TPA: hypothetical protein VGN12_16940 [Pirellulales bacterium]|jgi:hypothetical protein